MNWAPACLQLAGTLLRAFCRTFLRIRLLRFGVGLADRLDLFDVLRSRRALLRRARGTASSNARGGTENGDVGAFLPSLTAAQASDHRSHAC